MCAVTFAFKRAVYYRVWIRHLHYTHNLDGEPPPPVVKPSKKGPTAAKVLTTKEKQDFLLLVGL